MSNEDERKHTEAQPKTSEEILGEVGLTPENLVGKKVLFFSDTQKLSVTGAEITTGYPDAYDIFDEVVDTEKLHTMDYVLGVDSEALNTDASIPESVGFLAASVRALKAGGEIRVSLKEIDGSVFEVPMWEELYIAALRYHNVSAVVNYSFGEKPFVRIIPFSRITPNASLPHFFD